MTKSKNWIKSAIKHPGALRVKTHTKEGKNIPLKKINKLANSKNETTRRQAQLAKNLRKINK